MYFVCRMSEQSFRFLLIVIFTYVSRGYCFEYVESKVVFLSVIQVEGLKTPGRFYNEESNGVPRSPDEISDLTDEGQIEQYEVGRWLKSVYPSLIDYYYQDNVQVLSSNFYSSIMSAEALIKGMYLPIGKEVETPLETIAIQTIPQNQDNLIAMTAECRRYSNELTSDEYSRELFNTDIAYNDLYGHISDITGEIFYSVHQVRYLYDIIFLKKKTNESIPVWMEEIFTKLNDATILSLTLPTYTPTMQLLKSGPLISLIFNHTIEKYDKLKNEFELDDDVSSVRIYSVHVETMASFLNSLGIYNHLVPPYSSTLLWELIKTHEDEFMVKISYRNSSLDEPFVLKVPGCTELCPVHKMKSLLSKYLEPIDCFNAPLPLSDSIYFGTIGKIIIVSVIVAFFALLGYSCYKNEPKFIYDRLQSDEKNK